MNLEVFKKLQEGEDLASIAEHYDLTHDEVRELREGIVIYIAKKADFLKKVKWEVFSVACDLITLGEEWSTYEERRQYWNAVENLYTLRIFLEKEEGKHEE